MLLLLLLDLLLWVVNLWQIIVLLSFFIFLIPLTLVDLNQVIELRIQLLFVKMIDSSQFILVAFLLLLLFLKLFDFLLSDVSILVLDFAIKLV